MPRKKPLESIMDWIGRNVRLKLKDGREVEGTLVECDSYMNMVLGKASQYTYDKDGGEEKIGEYETVLLRGNNIIYIWVPEEAETS